MIEENRLESERKVPSEVLQGGYWCGMEGMKSRVYLGCSVTIKKEGTWSKIKDLALGKAESPRAWDNWNSRGHDLLRREPTLVHSVQKTCFEYKRSNLCWGVIRPTACSGFSSG